MKLEIAGRPVDARLEYVDASDRLMLRTEFALLAPDSIERLDIQILAATEMEMELLRVSGYAGLMQKSSTP